MRVTSNIPSESVNPSFVSIVSWSGVDTRPGWKYDRWWTEDWIMSVCGRNPDQNNVNTKHNLILSTLRTHTLATYSQHTGDGCSFSDGVTGLLDTWQPCQLCWQCGVIPCQVLIVCHNYFKWIIQNNSPRTILIQAAILVVRVATMKLLKQQIKDIITKCVYDYQQ